MDYLFVVCLTLLFFFLLTLLRKKGKTLSDRILAIWVTLLIATEFTFLLQRNGLFLQLYPLFEVVCTSHILHGSFLFLYHKSFTNPRFTLRFRHLVHLVPFVALIIFKILLSEVFMVFHCKDEGGCSCAENPFTHWIIIIKIAVVGIYVTATFLKHISLKGNKEYLLKNNITRQSWIGLVVYSAVSFFILIAIIQIIPIVSVVNLNGEIDIVNIVISAFVFLFIYAGNKSSYFTANPFSGDASATKNKQISLDERLRDNFEVIEKHMSENRPYLDPELSLNDLAKQVNLSSLSVSQAIKASTEKSFPNYINAYRINAIAEKLKNPKYKQYTIIAVAYECGFNSKASFNRIFKLHTGKTPSEFIADMQN